MQRFRNPGMPADLIRTISKFRKFYVALPRYPWNIRGSNSKSCYKPTTTALASICVLLNARGNNHDSTFMFIQDSINYGSPTFVVSGFSTPFEWLSPHPHPSLLRLTLCFLRPQMNGLPPSPTVRLLDPPIFGSS